jgi:iron complex transport system substrate-binding protein
MSYRRIACLSTEAVETLYLLGAEDCIAGISGFTTRPARARKEKLKVSGFSSVKSERILAVRA